MRFNTAHDLVAAGVETLATFAQTHDVPILLTRETTASLSAPLVEAADSILDCELTRFGPRFVGEAFETLVYPVDGGFQTTLSYWAEILSVRFEALQAGTTPASAPSPASGTADESATMPSPEVSVDGTH